MNADASTNFLSRLRCGLFAAGSAQNSVRAQSELRRRNQTRARVPQATGAHENQLDTSHEDTFTRSRR
jgi:hypothetical protein